MVLMAFLLVLGIHACIVLCGMTKCHRVDATSETLNLGHSKVKGQKSAFSYQNQLGFFYFAIYVI